MLRKINNPIVVCGFARSGTTFVWRLLDIHPDIAMSDEFFVYKTPSLLPYFKEMGEAFGSLTARGNWTERKTQIMKMLWFYMSQSHRIENGMTGARRFGNKTPGAEHYIEFYDDVFKQDPPLYIYVIREGKKVFLSHLNMPWGKNAHIAGFLKRYLESISIAEAFQEKHPDRIYIFQIDRVENTYEARLAEIKKLFAFIGEEITEEILSFVKAWKPELSTEQVRREDPQSIVKKLSAKDEAFLNNNKEYQRIMEKYGYK